MSMYCPFTYKGYPEGLKYPWVLPMPTEKERDRRWQAIRKSMEKHGFDCIIVTTLPGAIPSTKDIGYISNYPPYATMGVYIVFPLSGESQMQISLNIGPQFVQYANEISWVRDIIGSFDPLRDLVNKIKQLKIQKGKLGILGYKRGSLSASVMDYLRKNLPQTDIRDASEVMQEAMNEVSRTSSEELKFLKKACKILDDSFEAIHDSFKAGVTECEVLAAAEYVIIKSGGWAPHSMHSTISQGPLFPRAPASHHKIAPGDIGVFELTPVYGGVTAQACYAICLGEPRPKVKKMFEFCEELYHFALTELEKQKTFMQIETGLGERIHTAGYEPMTPQIHIYNMGSAMLMNSTPHPGDYFTVHPNICDSKFTMGAKLGDEIRIGKTGKVERLNKTPVRLNIMPP